MPLIHKPQLKEFIKYFFSPTKYTPMVLSWSETAKHRIIFTYFVLYFLFFLVLLNFPVDNASLRVSDIFHDTIDPILIAWVFLTLKRNEWRKKSQTGKPIYLDILFLLILNRVYAFLFAFSDGFFLREEWNMFLLYVVMFYLFYATSKSLSILLEYSFWKTLILLFGLFFTLTVALNTLPY